MFKPMIISYVTVCLCLSGCSDYKINQHNNAGMGDSALSGAPIISVSPSEIDIDSTCSDLDLEVAVLNTGSATLEITNATISGPDWQISTPPFPINLEPDESSIWMLSGQGTDTLTIESNDPSGPVEVPIHAAENLPPDVHFIAPYNNFIIPVTGTVLSAQISDDIDDVTSIPLQWVSDVDGVLSNGFANQTGQTNLIWPSTHTAGPHLVTLSAVDSCNETSIAELSVCQQFGYDVETLDILTWHFEGAANWDTVNGWLELTPVTTNTVGTAFSTAIPVSGDNVEIEFSFYIGDGTGADGISLTALDTSRMTTFLGGTGCGIGYGGDAGCTNGPPLPGWSIEVDTYFNDGQDPTSDDHVMFTFDGDVDDPAVWASLPEMEDTGWHTMRVVVTAPHVLVTIDGVDYIDTDISGHYNFPAYVGFTAGTGGLTNRHIIDSLTVTETVCPTDG